MTYKATRASSTSHRWQYLLVTRQQALDIFRRALEIVEQSSDHLLDRQEPYGTFKGMGRLILGGLDSIEAPEIVAETRCAFNLSLIHR